MSKVTRRSKRTLVVSRIAICAALYAVANSVTAAIPTPFSIGQFRPGVIIPALFSIMFGTTVGAIGAALGSFVGDVIFLTPLGLTNPFLALVAGVPGNFVGFLIFGLIIYRFRSWSGFVVDSLVALFVGNLIAGAGVVLSVGLPLGVILGFTFWWLFTMLPFMFLVLPVILRLFINYQTGRALISEFLTWKEESLKKVASVSIVASLPLFLVFLLSYTQYLSGAFETLGESMINFGTVAELIRYLILGCALTLLFAPFAPKIAGAKK
jgi:uncharacterized membrane protein